MEKEDGGYKSGDPLDDLEEGDWLMCIMLPQDTEKMCRGHRRPPGTDREILQIFECTNIQDTFWETHYFCRFVEEEWVM